MGLQFQPYHDDQGAEIRSRWSRGLDGIFEQYQASKQQALAERDRQGAALLQNGGVDPRQVTPDVYAQADGPLMPGASSLVSHLHGHIERKKQGEAMSAKTKQADLDKTLSETDENKSQAEKNRRAPVDGGAPQVVNIKGVDYIQTTTAQGLPHYQPIPERQPTQSEYAAKGYSDKAQQAHSSLEALEKSGYEPSQIGNTFQSIAPTALQSKEFQGLDQSRRQFINAILRRESGAAISASENDNYTRQYFPVPGDKPEVKAQKAEARKLAIAGLSSEGHRVASNLPKDGAKGPAVGTIKNGYRFTGGNPADKASWVKQ